MRPEPSRLRLRARSRGLSTVEYLVILVLLVTVAVGAWQLFGQRVRCAVLLAGLGEASDEEAAAAFEKCPNAAGAASDGVARSARSSGGFGCNSRPSSSGPSPSPGPSGSASGSPPPAPPTPPPAPLSPADKLTADVLKVMCPSEKAFLRDLKNRGVTITAYDRIYWDDPYFDGKKWTTSHFEGGGSTFQTDIHIIRSTSSNSGEEDASTIYHEGVHTGQPGGMAWRDQEYDAYAKEDAFLIRHGLPPHTPSFRTKDAAGNPITDTAAIKAFVDKKYPGVTSTSSSGAQEQVVGRTPSGQTIVKRANGTTYTRKARKGDSFAGSEQTVPAGGIPLDMNKLQCP